MSAHRILNVLVRSLVVIAASIGLILAAPMIASAHDQLIESTPTEGQRFEASPGELTLRFSANPLELGTELAVVADTDGAAVALAPLRIETDTVVQPLPELTPGAYTLNWRVVSQDGHPIAGSIHFGVQHDAGTGPATAAPDEAQSTPAGTPPTDTAPSPWVVVGLSVVALAALVSAGIVVWAKLKRNDRPFPGSDTPGK